MRSLFYLALATAFLTTSSPAFSLADDDDDKPQTAARAIVRSPEQNGTPAPLNSNLQLAGIKTQILERAHQQPEFSAFGTIVSLEPLLQLRQQYLAAQAQQDGAKARYTEAHLNLSRTKNLHEQDIVSTRRLQEQQAQWQSDKAALDATSYQQQTILAASRLEWGDTLTDWFIRKPNQAADRFLQHHAQLLLVTLPPNTHLTPEIRRIMIDEHGRREQAIAATLISSSPRIDPVSQGERYFFSVEGRRIPFGAHVTAWIANGAEQSNGVIVPSSAVVWHLGQALAFVKTQNGQFGRRLINIQIPIGQGYFVSETLQAGEEIVITGAQTLLSQELKNQIPNEDDD